MTTQEKSLGLILYIALLVAGSWLLTSCSKSLIVESTTSWTGALGTSTLAEAGAFTVQGVGNSSVAADGATVCWLFRKTTARGSLRVYLRETSLLGADKVGDAVTVADFGSVAGCGQ